MKKTIILLLALLALNISNAQIATGRIGSGNITIANYLLENVYGIDFDNDGILEFRITDFDNWTNSYLSYNWTEGGNNIVANNESWDYIAILPAGEVINANSNFAGYGDAAFEDLSSSPNHIFVGFRIMLADGVHYGWAEAMVESMATTNDINVNWVNCAYNTIPGASIKAGQTVGIEEVEAEAFEAYSLGQKTIRIEAANNDVIVYDINGRKLNTVNAGDNKTITLPSTGVYIVRSGKTTRKLVVL